MCSSCGLLRHNLAPRQRPPPPCGDSLEPTEDCVARDRPLVLIDVHSMQSGKHVETKVNMAHKTYISTTLKQHNASSTPSRPQGVVNSYESLKFIIVPMLMFIPMFSVPLSVPFLSPSPHFFNPRIPATRAASNASPWPRPSCHPLRLCIAQSAPSARGSAWPPVHRSAPSRAEDVEPRRPSHGVAPVWKPSWSKNERKSQAIGIIGITLALVSKDCQTFMPGSNSFRVSLNVIEM